MKGSIYEVDPLACIATVSSLLTVIAADGDCTIGREGSDGSIAFN